MNPRPFFFLHGRCYAYLKSSRWYLNVNQITLSQCTVCIRFGLSSFFADVMAKHVEPHDTKCQVRCSDIYLPRNLSAKLYIQKQQGSQMHQIKTCSEYSATIVQMVKLRQPYTHTHTRAHVQKEELIHSLSQWRKSPLLTRGVTEFTAMWYIGRGAN